ncbi:Beta-glucosidase 10 [Castilleja foliolosa]|uniref:Beta-glucosidase 10 n=1 Tax=Castilleja foliolosa TaxID=1961234 RepID=A0ABD3ENM7_9LAMI
MDSDSSSAPLIPLVDREITRHDFPTDFVFGCATSAYQVEGAYAKGGRAYSIWDVYTNGYPANILDGSNANMAVDMYNRYKDDIRLMKNMGFDAYRFSISWSRILPGGKLSLGVNREGLDYYNDLINTIIDNV